MYRDTYQRGMLTIFYSVGAKPLSMWDTTIQDGYVSRFLDDDIKSLVFEIGGSNVSTTFMTCPKGNAVLGISMPFLIMVVKNLRKYFSFEVTILDVTGARRRFRISNFQSTTQVLPLCTVMPINLTDGWNQIQFNLAEFTRKAYNRQFFEVLKVKINANIRLRRIYFADKLVPDEELPAEYKLYFPVQQKVLAAKEKPPLKVLKQKPSRVQPKPSEQSQEVKESGQETPQQPSQTVRHKQKFENAGDQDKIPDIKKDKSKPIGSVQVLKNVSTLQDLSKMDERESNVMELPEEHVEQPIPPGETVIRVEEEPKLEVTGGETDVLKNTTDVPVQTEPTPTENKSTEVEEERDDVADLIDEIEGF
nr:cilia- and flagella-associated protein 20-like [Helicoverpa armigera]